MAGKPVNLDNIVKEFQALAAQTGSRFTVRDAEAASVWSCYKGVATGLTFNQVKELAGLPFKTRAPNGQGMLLNKYEPCILKPAKGKLKQCLGILPNDTHCKKTVYLPARLCNKCRERNNSI